MAEWIYFLHTPREHFVSTMTAEEREVWTEHAAHLRALLERGVLIAAGPTLGPINTGIQIFEADDEASARRVMESDPAIAGGYARGELRPFRLAFLRPH